MSSQNTINQLAQVFKGVPNSVKLIAGLAADATIPMIAEDLRKVDNLLGPAAKALGWVSAVADPVIALGRFARTCHKLYRLRVKPST